MDLFEPSLLDNSPDFSEYKISGKDIRLILEYASWAPSPYNSQPWEFIIIQEQEHIRRIASIIFPDRSQTKEYLESLPNLLFYMMDTSRRDPGENFYKLGLISMGAAIANLTRAASQKGIALQPFSFPSGKAPGLSNLKNHLRIPEKVVLCGFFGLGYLKDKENPAKRKTAEKLIVHENRFGNLRENDKLKPQPIEKNPFFLMRERKSYRHKFLEQPLSLRDEDSLIKAAVNSFNVNKKRNWELLFIKDKTLIDSFADLIIKISFNLYLEAEYTEKMKAWTRYTLKEEREKTDGVLIVLWKKFLGHLLKAIVLSLEKFTFLKPLRTLLIRAQSKEFFGKLVRESPLLIAFIYSKKQLESFNISYLSNLVNVGIAVQNILLTGTALNMGAQFLTVMMDTESGRKRVKKLLQIPGDIEVVEMIRIGYIDPEASKRLLSLSDTLRRSVDKIAHREFYSAPF